MFVVTVTFIVAPDQIETFMPLMVENAKASLELEPGCRHFDVCQNPEQPTEIFLYELYDDAEAFEVHKGMTHFLEFSAKTDAMVVSKAVKTFALVTE